MPIEKNLVKKRDTSFPQRNKFNQEYIEVLPIKKYSQEKI